MYVYIYIYIYIYIHICIHIEIPLTNIHNHMIIKSSGAGELGPAPRDLGPGAYDYYSY